MRMMLAVLDDFAVEGAETRGFTDSALARSRNGSPRATR
jgi:hypothetical protein